MKAREVLEWLSLAPADIPCWLACGALAGMWFAPGPVPAGVFGVIAIGLSLLACYLGMRPRRNFSRFTNFMKLTGYPLFAVIIAAAVIWIFAVKQYPISGGSSPRRPFDETEALTKLQAQAAEVEQAMVRENHERMADLTHPVLVNHFGGKAQFIKQLKTEANDLRRQGLKFHGFRFSRPSKVVESAGDLYAIYPYSLELTGPNGEPAGQPSYLICVSSDGGKTWKFLDGEGVGSDRAKLKRWLPDFPTELPLPERQPLKIYPKDK